MVNQGHAWPSASRLCQRSSSKAEGDRHGQRCRRSSWGYFDKPALAGAQPSLDCAGAHPLVERNIDRPKRSGDSICYGCSSLLWLPLWLCSAAHATLELHVRSEAAAGGARLGTQGSNKDLCQLCSFYNSRGQAASFLAQVALIKTLSKGQSRKPGVTCLTLWLVYGAYCGIVSICVSSWSRRAMFTVCTTPRPSV